MPAGSADLVLGHGLLEVVDDPARAVAALAAAADAGAAVSVLIAGRYAAVLSRTLAGRLAEARALLTDPDGRFGPDDALRRRLGAGRAAGAARGRAGCGWRSCRATACWRAGCRAPPATAGPRRRGPSAELEELATGVTPLRDVAARLHALARRRRARRPGAPGADRSSRTRRSTAGVVQLGRRIDRPKHVIVM